MKNNMQKMKIIQLLDLIMYKCNDKQLLINENYLTMLYKQNCSI